MKAMLFVSLLILSFTVSVRAQATSQPSTAAAENEVLKIEQEQVKAMLKGGSVAADWFGRMFDGDIAYTGPDGNVFTKAQLQAEYRTGQQKMRSAQHADYRVVTYATTVVVTYRVNDTLERKGKILSAPGLATDVLVKQNGAWRIVDHQVTPVSW